MDTLRLDYPVYTLDNTLLLPAGAELSGETLEALIASTGTEPFTASSLLRFGSLKKDILHFLGLPPYDTIFADDEKIAYVLHLMGRVHLPLPFLESLDHFKQHDPYTYHHTLMVFCLSTLLAKDLITDHEERIRETATGPTHDFGKVCVPLHILKKTTPLARTERSMLEHHAAAGYVLLSHYLKDARHIAATVARDHHERRNGSGYPRMIALSDRSVEIIAACDVYDALISPRPYRPVSYDNRTALEELSGMAERNELGWEVVRALISHNRKARIHFSEVKVSAEKRGTPPAGNFHGLTAEEKDS